MSSVITIRLDLDNSRPPPGERNASAAGNAARLFQISQAACERLDKIQVYETIQDDLVR